MAGTEWCSGAGARTTGAHGSNIDRLLNHRRSWYQQVKQLSGCLESHRCPTTPERALEPAVVKDAPILQGLVPTDPSWAPAPAIPPGSQIVPRSVTFLSAPPSSSEHLVLFFFFFLEVPGPKSLGDLCSLLLGTSNAIQPEDSVRTGGALPTDLEVLGTHLEQEGSNGRRCACSMSRYLSLAALSFFKQGLNPLQM